MKRNSGNFAGLGSEPKNRLNNVQADLDEDNAITIFDYQILSNNFDKHGDN
ncbi:MAG: hypothetical protein JST40_11415 [Armatimonadetes bacterium]|nr:hypothetical protein [Armatimonadota bacterium]